MQLHLFTDHNEPFLGTPVILIDGAVYDVLHRMLHYGPLDAGDLPSKSGFESLRTYELAVRIATLKPDQDWLHAATPAGLALYDRMQKYKLADPQSGQSVLWVNGCAYVVTVEQPECNWDLFEYVRCNGDSQYRAPRLNDVVEQLERLCVPVGIRLDFLKLILHISKRKHTAATDVLKLYVQRSTVCSSSPQ